MPQTLDSKPAAVNPKGLSQTCSWQGFTQQASRCLARASAGHFGPGLRALSGGWAFRVQGRSRSRARSCGVVAAVLLVLCCYVACESKCSFCRSRRVSTYRYDGCYFDADRKCQCNSYSFFAAAFAVVSGITATLESNISNRKKFLNIRQRQILKPSAPNPNTKA